MESIVAHTICNLEQTAEHVRLVGLPATLPNYEDVALKSCLVLLEIVTKPFTGWVILTRMLVSEFAVVNGVSVSEEIPVQILFFFCFFGLTSSIYAYLLRLAVTCLLSKKSMLRKMKCIQYQFTTKYRKVALNIVK